MAGRSWARRVRLLVAVSVTGCSGATGRSSVASIVDDGAALEPVAVTAPLFVRATTEILAPFANGEHVANWGRALDAARAVFGSCTPLETASGAAAYDGLYTSTSSGPSATPIYNQLPAYVIRALYTPCPGGSGSAHTVMVVVDAETAQAIAVLDDGYNPG